MIKRFIILKAKRGMPRQDFIDYYENHHAPLARSLFPYAVYRRHFVKDIVFAPDGADELSFDVMTEASFANDADYETYLELKAKPEIWSRIKADEEHFVEPGSVWSFTVDDRE